MECADLTGQYSIWWSGAVGERAARGTKGSNPWKDPLTTNLVAALNTISLAG
jgi:hypothetical protein